jgi:hypothetical protein
LAALFVGRIKLAVSSWSYRAGWFFRRGVFLKAALMGWLGLCGLARRRLIRFIGVRAGFFENWGKPARFLDLLLEPFLPMPI